MTEHLKDQVAIITGASRGIGRSTAIALATEGVNLALVSRTESGLKETAAECEKMGVKTLCLPTDLTDPFKTEEVVKKTVKEFGKLHILINNAGKFSRNTVQEAKLDKWDEVINVNLRSLIHLTRHSLPYILKNKKGGIINIASISGKNTYGTGGIYNATKFGVVGFTGALYEDIREENIKVCAICPGFVSTDMTKSDTLDSSKMIQPGDIADTVLFVLKFPGTGCPTEIIVRPQHSPYI